MKHIKRKIKDNAKQLAHYRRVLPYLQTPHERESCMRVIIKLQEVALELRDELEREKKERIKKYVLTPILAMAGAILFLMFLLHAMDTEAEIQRNKVQKHLQEQKALEMQYLR